MKIDVHGMRVEAAIKHIIKSIDIALDHRDYVVEITHGFNRGSAIQKRVLSLQQKDHPSILRVRSHLTNPGISIIDLRIEID